MTRALDSYQIVQSHFLTEKMAFIKRDIEDKSIRPVTNIRLTRMDIDYESIDIAANEIFSASADEVRRRYL